MIVKLPQQCKPPKKQHPDRSQQAASSSRSVEKWLWLIERHILHALCLTSECYKPPTAGAQRPSSNVSKNQHFICKHVVLVTGATFNITLIDLVTNTNQWPNTDHLNEFCCFCYRIQLTAGQRWVSESLYGIVSLLEESNMSSDTSTAFH